MPAFVRSVTESMPGFGSGGYNGSIIGTVQAGAGTVALTIPASGATTPSGGTAFNSSGMPGPTRGKGRFRVTALGGATTTTITSTVTDGTTTLNVLTTPTSPASALVDWSYEFNTDLSITSVSASVVLATSGGTVDWEISMT